MTDITLPAQPASSMVQVADKALDKVSNFVDVAAAKATNVFEAL